MPGLALLGAPHPGSAKQLSANVCGLEEWVLNRTMLRDFVLLSWLLPFVFSFPSLMYVMRKAYSSQDTWTWDCFWNHILVHMNTGHVHGFTKPLSSQKMVAEPACHIRSFLLKGIDTEVGRVTQQFLIQTCWEIQSWFIGKALKLHQINFKESIEFWEIVWLSCMPSKFITLTLTLKTGSGNWWNISSLCPWWIVNSSSASPRGVFGCWDSQEND